MLVNGFTISYSFEGNIGRKSSTFISVNFTLPEPMSTTEVETVRLEASQKVSIWAIQDALCRGEITVEDAKMRMDIIKKNFEGIKERIDSRKDV